MTERSKKGPVSVSISERGLQLERANQAQQSSNLHNGTMVVIGQTENGGDIGVAVGSKCPICKKRVRGLHHASGMHHRGVVPRNSR